MSTQGTDPRRHSPWIGVDLDGTLAENYESYDSNEVGKPVESMVKKVRQLVHEGHDVRLFTARSPHPAIRRWMKEHLGTVLPITNTKDPGMLVMYDDRAVHVHRNQGVFSEEGEKRVLSRKK